MLRGVDASFTGQTREYKNADPTIAVYEVTEESPNRPQEISFPIQRRKESLQQASHIQEAQRQDFSHTFAMSGYATTQDAPPTIYVRALYDYDADDHTSLSFRKGDVIQVLTQLESGWWDGVINDVRGWFPSNYCAIVSGPDDPGDDGPHGQDGETSAESGTEDEYEYSNEEDYDSEGNPRDDNTTLPLEGTGGSEHEEAAFWIPQATPDGRLFYFNIMTGVSTMELPLELTALRNESGPHDRTNFNIPDQTRPPPEMMAGGFERDEDQYDGSASEAEGESLIASRGSLPRNRRSLISDGISPATSLDSINASPVKRTRKESKDFYGAPGGSISAVQRTMPPLGVSSTSFANSPNVANNPTIPRYFLDDGTTVPMTWSRLVDNMRISIEAYKLAIQNGDRAEFVHKAEDISDHLRMLLAAGSGTTDNHSGNPSIISTNKALYPHFRDMMSKFSKLVLSSHIAAADWPGPDSYAKCLSEADGVLNSIYGYVDVARQQRGDEIPRLVPGFVHGSVNGGNWQNNNLDLRERAIGTSFMDYDDADRPFEPTAPLDAQLISDVDECRRPLIVAIKKLQERLYLSDKIITPVRQASITDSICDAATNALDLFRPWIAVIESVDLAPLGSAFETPLLVSFSVNKQKVYDAVAELVTTCQAVGAPLSDEWAELRGESLEDRLNSVRTSSKQLDSAVSETSFSLQLLLSSMPNVPPPSTKSNHRLTDGGETYTQTHLRGDSLASRPQLADVGQSNSYTVGMEVPPEKFRKANADKARRFFGQMPPPSVVGGAGAETSKEEDAPWYLKLDHEHEVFYDNKTDPPQLKSGTLTGLVEQLTRHDRLDAAFNGTFLLTYRSFTTAAELFQMLVRRFSVQPPAGISAQDFATWEEKKQKPIRFRVVNVLKAWLENYWMEGTDDASMALLQSIYQFVKNSIASTKTPGSGPLIAVVEQRLKGQDTTAKKLVLTLTNSAPPPILPKNMRKLKFLDIDPMEFARQLTIIEARLYGKIKPTECLNKTWSKKVAPGEPDLAPNVKALILHSNQLTNWVAEMILSQGDVKRRVVVIKHFVAIADKCRLLNNYSGLTAIISAFGTAPILRLKRTWDQLNQKTGAVLESMRKLMSNIKNFSEYREKLHLANPPCIPFFGVYLTDLTFIEDGIASVVKNSNLINFTKRTKTAEVIRDIQQYQNVPYSLSQVPELQDYILEHMKGAGDVHEMYDKSLQVEPREREDEKITRLLSESGFL